MEVRVLDSAYIYNFNLDTERIRQEIKLKLLEGLPEDTMRKLSNWNLYFYFRYNNVEEMLMYLKGRSMPNAKEKEITVHIPMPIIEDVSWGVLKEDHIYDNPKHLNDILKNFECLAVDFSKFTTKEDYVKDCMWRAVRYCFKKGIKVNGVELKMEI